MSNILIAMLFAVFICGFGAAGETGPFRLADGDLEAIDEIVGKIVPLEVAAKFRELYDKWPKIPSPDGKPPPTEYIDDVLKHWEKDGPGVPPPLSSHSFDYIRTKEYRELRRMGRAILPLIVQKMARERDPYTPLCLYRELQKNQSLFPYNHDYRDPTSYARRLAKLWLDEQLRQKNAMNPDDVAALGNIARGIPEPVRKEFAWRFHDWRVARADEIRRDVPADLSDCGGDLPAMGRDILPLLLRETALSPGGWQALPLCEKLGGDAGFAIPEREASEHPQAHAARTVKQWLAGRGDVQVSDDAMAEFCNFPISPDDLAELRHQAETVPPERAKQFGKELAVWQLTRAPDGERAAAWWEILTGGPEVDRLQGLGGDGLVLLVREMAEDPAAGQLLPLYKALQTDRILLPMFPDAAPGPAVPCGPAPTARRAAKIWLDVHRRQADDETTRETGSPKGPLPHLPAPYARRILEVVADIPDAFRKGFLEDYALWRLHAWGLVPASSAARERYVGEQIAGRVRSIGAYAVPMLMERIAFDPDRQAASRLLWLVSRKDAEASYSHRPWLTGALSIVKNWVENNTQWHGGDEKYALRKKGNVEQ